VMQRPAMHEGGRFNRREQNKNRTEPDVHAVFPLLHRSNDVYRIRTLHPRPAGVDIHIVRVRPERAAREWVAATCVEQAPPRDCSGGGSFFSDERRGRTSHTIGRT
jgi:hypothetical protein